MRLLYVIQAKTGQIKVGLSMHPSERVEQFRIGSPVPIRLIAILGPGNRLDEINLQRSLDGDHSHGEWFLGEKASAFATSVMGCGLTSVADWPPASTGFSAYRTAGIRRGRETKTSLICDATGLSAKEAAIRFRDTHSAKQIGDALGVSRNVIIGHWFRAMKSGELGRHD